MSKHFFWPIVSNFRSNQNSSPQMTSVIAISGQCPEREVQLQYSDVKVVGNGSFGTVYMAKLVGTGELVAIKKVLQDRRFKNRELQIMQKMNHKNVVQLKYFYYTNDDKKDDRYLNLILEYVPDTIYRVAKHYSKLRQAIPIIYVKVYMFQLLRALAYIHRLGICHRDIKPQNLLIDTETSVLKLCDFGSAKYLVKDEPNVAYICSRYYRAPELMFGATRYTNSIDIWSAGTVLAELLLGRPIFPGGSGVNQVVEIIKVLGTPTKADIQKMNPEYKEHSFPLVKVFPWSQVFRVGASKEAIDLVSQMLVYRPDLRPTALVACTHQLFDDLRKPGAKLPNGKPMPNCCDFTAEELGDNPSLAAILCHQEETNSSDMCHF